jgi:3-hydroxyacyl-[acyl-carrier-protein] dehydratase
MLKNDFYTVKRAEITGSKAVFCIALNAEHKIYQGHFPGMPVVPGVCQMQIAKELLAVALGQDVAAYKARDIKFLNMMDPSKTGDLTLQLDYTENTGSWAVSGLITGDGLKYLKFKAEYCATDRL